MTLSLRLTDRGLAAAAVLALIMEFWLLVSDVHFIWRPLDVAMPRRVVAVIEEADSRVLVRTPLQLSWQDARKGQRLHEGDEVATLDASTARIRFTDRESLRLGPNSLLSVRRARSAGKSAFKLALVRGSIFQDRPAEPAGPPVEKRFEIDVGGRKLLAGGENGFSIRDFKPGSDPVLNLGSQPAAAPPLPRAGVASVLPELPRITGPSNGSVLVNPESVRLSWAAHASAASLTLEIARDASFAKIVTRQRVEGQAGWSFHPESKGRFHWRLIATGDQGRVAVSEARVFDVARELTSPKLLRPQIEVDGSRKDEKLEAPKLRKPSIRYQPGASLGLRVLRMIASLVSSEAHADETRASASAAAAAPAAAAEDTHARYAVKLAWYGVPGAHAYTLQISTDPRFQHQVAEKILTEASYLWRTNVAGFYYWRVAAVDAEGDRGPFSEFMTFDIKADRNLPGDETTYETYLKFDEYTGHEQRFRLLGGPEYEAYNFSPTAPISPSQTRYSKLTARLAQLEYEYRIDNHVSLMLGAKTVLYHLTSTNFEGRPNQNGLNENITNLFIGAERRIFGPHHYYSLEGSIRISMMDIVVGNEPQLQLSTFTFVGLQALAGYHRPLGRDYNLALKAGPMYLYGNQSSWYGGLAREQLSKAVNDIFTVGLRFEQEYQLFHFEADNLAGNATRVRLSAFGFLEFNF